MVVHHHKLESKTEQPQLKFFVECCFIVFIHLKKSKKFQKFLASNFNEKGLFSEISQLPVNGSNLPLIARIVDLEISKNSPVFRSIHYKCCFVDFPVDFT